VALPLAPAWPFKCMSGISWLRPNAKFQTELFRFPVACVIRAPSSSSSSLSSQVFLKWPKQQRHHEDHYSHTSSISHCCNSSGIIMSSNGAGRLTGTERKWRHLVSCFRPWHRQSERRDYRQLALVIADIHTIFAASYFLALITFSGSVQYFRP